MKKGIVLLLAALALEAHASAPTLGDLYKTLRPILCMAMSGLFDNFDPLRPPDPSAVSKSMSSCKLPKDLVFPVGWSVVRLSLERAPNVYVVGIPSNASEVKAVFSRRLLGETPGRVTWAVLPKDAEELRRWWSEVEKAAPKKDGEVRSFGLDIVRVEETDLIGTVSRIPFVLAGNKVFFSVDGNLWLEPVAQGGVASTVLTVVKLGTTYLLSTASARQQVEEREAR